MFQTEFKNEIQQIAFEMFRDFTKSVVEKHPEIKICINNETKIVNDLKSTIELAQKRLKEKYLTEKEIENFHFGFMLGFIRSNLNTKWVYEYIIKQSNQYKEFLVIKALQIFFNDNLVDRIRVDAKYKDLLANDNNLLDFEAHIVKVEIGNNEVDELNQSTNESQLLQTLENYIDKYISDYMQKEEAETYVWPVVKYFNTRGIKQLVTFDFKNSDWK